MTNSLPILLLTFALLLLPGLLLASQTKLPLMLAKELNQAVDLTLYLVSEKYDGVRAVWIDGRLTTRSGFPILAPKWFVDALPERDLEGELWMGYGRFDDISALARSVKSEDLRWREVQFLVFDLPGSILPFEQRAQEIDTIVESANRAWLKSVRRDSFDSEDALKKHLDLIVARGGEGLMLNNRHSHYEPVRTDAILKYKPVYDDEAQVVKVIEGQGKYIGKMGSLEVKLKNGRLMKIGTGYTDKERSNPPQPGDWITFEYSGFTSTGLPRFARYKRRYVPQ